MLTHSLALVLGGFCQVVTSFLLSVCLSVCQNLLHVGRADGLEGSARSFL